MDLLTQPIFWVGIVLLIAGWIAISIMVGKKRQRELEELDSFFPGEDEYSTTGQISVEKVRRQTNKRKERMQQTQRIERTPRTDLGDLESQELVYKDGHHDREEDSGDDWVDDSVPMEPRSRAHVNRPVQPSWLRKNEPNPSTKRNVEVDLKEDYHEESPADSRKSFKKSLLASKQDVELGEEVEASPTTGFNKFQRNNRNSTLYEQEMEKASASSSFRRKRFK
ncbi:hypothetical protein [Risungbinella massiliensis]|uniref:hypothetical protein n=1 Tax=Risungbinella massiliensis TaxID=1329796 RepID=UPI0005CBC9FC|nr:hypothetical protein [Risungbinella massiliensis]